MPATSHRSTKQKTAILRLLRQHAGAHVTADTLAEELRHMELPVGRATVYRYLKQLEQEGHVRKYQLPEQSGSCYVYLEEGSACQGHCHLRCQRCGAVFHVDGAFPGEFVEQIARMYAFTIDESKTVFYGVCGNCRKEESQV